MLTMTLRATQAPLLASDKFFLVGYTRLVMSWPRVEQHDVRMSRWVPFNTGVYVLRGLVCLLCSFSILICI